MAKMSNLIFGMQIEQVLLVVRYLLMELLLLKPISLQQ